MRTAAYGSQAVLRRSFRLRHREAHGLCRQSASLSFLLPMAFQVTSIKILKIAVGFPTAIHKEECISHKFRNAQLAVGIAY